MRRSAKCSSKPTSSPTTKPAAWWRMRWPGPRRAESRCTSSSTGSAPAISRRAFAPCSSRPARRCSSSGPRSVRSACAATGCAGCTERSWWSTRRGPLSAASTSWTTSMRSGRRRRATTMRCASKGRWCTTSGRPRQDSGHASPGCTFAAAGRRRMRRFLCPRRAAPRTPSLWCATTSAIAATSRTRTWSRSPRPRGRFC